MNFDRKLTPMIDNSVFGLAPYFLNQKFEDISSLNLFHTKTVNNHVRC